MTHRGPHWQTAHPQFNNYATAGFVSHIEEIITRHRIDLWISSQMPKTLS